MKYSISSDKRKKCLKYRLILSDFYIFIEYYNKVIQKHLTNLTNSPFRLKLKNMILK